MGSKRVGWRRKIEGGNCLITKAYRVIELEAPCFLRAKIKVNKLLIYLRALKTLQRIHQRGLKVVRLTIYTYDIYT